MTEVTVRTRAPRWSPLSWGLAWLRNVPVDDPVDRRNAPMLQLVSLLLAVPPALAWLYRGFVSSVPWRDGELVSMAMSLAVCSVAALCFVLIRRGRFGLAARLLLLVFAVTVIPAYAATGFTAQRFEQPILVLWMVLAGLVVGRAALWAMFGCVLAAFVLGGRVDAGRMGSPDFAVDVAISGAMFLVIAVVLDRASAALRTSLREATERGDALVVANARLQLEIREREEAQNRLVHAQKVEAAGRLASGLAHDFNNLLSLILGYAKRGRSGDVEAMPEAFDGIEAVARRASAVSNKLLSFSRQDSPRPEVFDAIAMLAELKPVLRQLFDPGVSIEVEADGAPLPIRFDRSQFELLVLNIAANANHAMPDGGTFRLSVEASGQAVRMQFSDTGAGMPAEVQARVFEPFFTTKPSGSGTGLGLFVVRDLVSAAGGSVSVRSEPGAGTEIGIELPLADTAA